MIKNNTSPDNTNTITATTTISECLTEHANCTGIYKDSMDMGLVIYCGCRCHEK
jgi:hypothetical protein